jgi:CHAT domain-containing protein
VYSTNSAEVLVTKSSNKNVQLPYTHEYLDKAEAYFYQNKDDSAILEYKIALFKFKNEENWSGYIKCCYKLGTCFNYKNQKDTAYAYLMLAKRLAYETIGQGDLSTVYVHYFIGDYYRTTGMPEEAMDEFLLAKSLLDAYHPKDHPSNAHVLDFIGEMYLLYQSNPGKAEEFYKEAIRIREKNNEANSPDVANNYFNLAKASHHKGDYQKALSYNQKALFLFNSFKGNFLPHVSNCYIQSANIQSDMGNYSVAINQYQLAIENLKRGGSDTFYLVNYYNNLGAVFVQNNEIKNAIHAIDQSLQRNVTSVDSLELINSFSNLAICYEKSGQMDSAKKYIQKDLALSLGFFPAKHPHVSSLYQQMGNWHMKNKKVDSSLSCFQKALCSLLDSYQVCEDVHHDPDPNMLQNNVQLLELLLDKAYALEFKFNSKKEDVSLLHSALRCYSLCDKIMKLNRLAFERETSKLFMADIYRHAYERALHCAYQLYRQNPKEVYIEEIYGLMEKSKSSLLLESLHEIEALNDKVIPVEWKQKEHAIQSTLAELEFTSQIIKGKKGMHVEREKLLWRIDSSILSQEDQLEKLKSVLRTNFPSYYEAKYKRKEMTLALVRQQMKEKDQLVEYFWGDSSLYVLRVSKGTSTVYKLDHVKQLKEALITYQGLVTSNPVALAEKEQMDAFEEYGKIAFYLFQHLLSPVLDKGTLKSPKSRVILIPDGPLCAIPFESLLSKLPTSNQVNYKTLPYLLYDYQLSYASSCSILFDETKQKALSSPFKPLFFSYSKPKEERSNDGLSFQRDDLELPNAYRLKKLALDLGGEYCIASKDNIQHTSKNFNVLHFYLHAVPDTQNTSNSRLLLQQKQTNNPDGELRLHELYGMDFKNKLVVLNACETGIGKHYRGEGVYSLARGFTHAGSSSIIMSLWKIDDGPTFQLMSRFYEELIARSLPREALYESKLYFLRQQDHLSSHPAFWAGVIAMDNQYELFFMNRFEIWILKAGIAILILCCLGIIQHSSISSSHR